MNKLSHTHPFKTIAKSQYNIVKHIQFVTSLTHSCTFLHIVKVPVKVPDK